MNLILTEGLTPAGDPEGQMTLGPLTFDQRNGIGQVPFNENIKYMGFAVLMTPSQFLRLAEARDFGKGSGLVGIKEALSSGKPMGSPFLDLLIDDSDGDTTLVRQHEGRTRMKAVQEIWGEIPVLVHMFPASGLRARHLSLDIISACRETMIPQAQKVPLVGPHFAPTVWWTGGWKALP